MLDFCLRLSETTCQASWPFTLIGGDQDVGSCSRRMSQDQSSAKPLISDVIMEVASLYVKVSFIG